jgi:hypothetical protein
MAGARWLLLPLPRAGEGWGEGAVLAPENPHPTPLPEGEGVQERGL